MGEANSHSEDPISEAIKILEDTTNLGKAKNVTENIKPPDKDDSDNAEIDRSENMSSEQNFWFKLARSDEDETK
ncbi:MAG: hypothetical protein NWE76_05910 [Candidatus Bathyarchaeota archaeon]|nr:hypothetical protein [Candidatus Bathyarchaeota archaeon]